MAQKVVLTSIRTEYIAVLLLLTLFMFALNLLPSDMEITAESDLMYCEMVRLHKADPTIGWPDYKRIYDKECDE